MHRHVAGISRALAMSALLSVLCGGVAHAQTPSTSAAQAFPNKPVRFVTGSAAGGGGDLTARAIAQKLSASLGQQVIVDDKPGATGMIANRFVAAAPPDGYTILLQPSSFICVSPHFNSTENWDPSKNLT